MSLAISYVSETDFQVGSNITSYELIAAAIFIYTGIAVSPVNINSEVVS